MCDYLPVLSVCLTLAVRTLCVQYATRRKEAVKYEFRPGDSDEDDD
jgi:hypothetical protein